VKRRVGILISGRGSNMTALLRAAAAPAFPADIALVLSNRPDAPGLDTARSAATAPPTRRHWPRRWMRRGSRSSAWPATCGC